MNTAETDRFLRLPAATAKLGLSRTGIYDRLDPRSPRHDPTFPRPVKLGARAVAFSERELNAWVAARIAERDRLAA